MDKKTWASFKTRVEQVDPRTLQLLEVNAHYFPHERFQRLVSNIKQDGTLTSVPFAALDKKTGKFEVLSGNHRVKAAIEAGLTEITVMLTDDDIPRGQKMGIELSHNALVGEDDKGTLKFLYEMIDDIESKIYSGLDDKMLEALDKSLTETLREAQLEFKTLMMLFLPDEFEEAKKRLKEIKEKLGSNKEVWLCYDKDYDRWLDTIEEVGSAHGVSNVATSFSLMLKMVASDREKLLDKIVEVSNGEYKLRQPGLNKSIPVQTVFDVLHIPPKDVPVIKNAIDVMVEEGLPSNKKISAIGEWARFWLESRKGKKSADTV